MADTNQNNKFYYDLYAKIKSLVLFRDFAYSDLGLSLSGLLVSAADEGLTDELNPDLYFYEEYGDLCREIYSQGGDLGQIIKDYIYSGANLYLDKYIGGEVTEEMETALTNELDTLQAISQLTSRDIVHGFLKDQEDNQAMENLPQWANTEINVKEEFLNLLRGLSTKGYGIFYDTAMFTFDGESIVPVKNGDHQSLDSLYGYQRERSLVMKNTEALAKGAVASNVLLYGDAGTGKSTTVKSCANAFFDQGVRLVEFKKDQVGYIPQVAEELSRSPLKFIIFVDDLTFSENDKDFYALKGILEGNVRGKSNNVIIYATSNRRHLVKESMEDRQGTDIHLNDTLQETMSLSARFGLIITFMKPEKDTYLSIVEGLAKDYGLISENDANYEVSLGDLMAKAEAFAIRANGRSPRTAKQFVISTKNGVI